MIAKHVTREGDSSFIRLAGYILTDKHQDETTAWQRLVDYMVDGKTKGDRVGTVRITNSEHDELAYAVKDIELTQGMNLRSKVDKTFHLVISFPPGERPAADQLKDIEDELCKAIGYADHQRISVTHEDTEHFHMHVAINKIHPTTFKNVPPWHSQFKLRRACEHLEPKYGLTRTGQGQATERRKQDRVADAEAHRGEESFLTWVRNNATAGLLMARDQAKTWQEFHEAAAKLGVEIRPRGAGLVVSPLGQRRPHVKASDIDPHLSMYNMTDRLGEYVPPAQTQVQAPQEPGQPQQPSAAPSPAPATSPLHRHPAAPELYAEYLKVRQATLAARTAALDTLRKERDAYLTDLRAYHQRQRDVLKSRREVRGLERRNAYQALAQERTNDWAADRERAARDRKATWAKHPMPTWPDWLAEQARQGTTDALAVLRSLERTRQRLAAALLRAETAEQGKNILLPGQRRVVNRDGSVTYTIADGGLVRDDAPHIAVERVTVGASTLAVLLAAERYGSQPLAVQGTDEFKRQVSQAAGLGGLDIRFSDPQMEADRRAAQAARQAARARAAHALVLDRFIANRNADRGTIPGALPLRRWQPTDAGEVIYQGHRALSDKSEVVLLERGGDVLVMPATANQVAKAVNTLHVGQHVHIDNRGRFVQGRDLSADQVRGRGR